MHFSQWPRALDISRYQAVRLMLKEKYRHIQGILAVQEFGSIPHPGISDMDFFVIVEPSKTVILPPFSSYSDEERYIISHRHYVISAPMWPFLQYLDPWFLGCIPLCGDTKTYAFHPRNFSSEGYAALSLNFMYQKWLYGCLNYLAETLSTGTLQVRHFFEEFKNFRYFYREFRKIGHVAPPDDPSQNLYDDMGRRWFAMTRQEQERILHDAWNAFLHSLDMVTPILLQATKERISYVDTPACIDRCRHQKYWKKFPSSIVLDLKTKVYIYQRGVAAVSIEKEVRYSAPLFTKSSRILYRLPLEFFGYPAHHIFSQGNLSAYYRDRLSTDLETLPLYKNEDLAFLHTIANNDLHASRNVRHGKWYQICYGYRPISDDPLPRVGLLRRFYRIILSLCDRVISASVLLFPYKRNELWHSMNNTKS